MCNEQIKELQERVKLLGEELRSREDGMAMQAETIRELRAELAAIRAQVAVPEGWKLVPIDDFSW